MDAAFLGLTGLALVIFLIIATVMFILMPFFVYGIRTKVTETNSLLIKILDRLPETEAEPIIELTEKTKGYDWN